MTRAEHESLCYLKIFLVTKKNKKGKISKEELVMTENQAEKLRVLVISVVLKPRNLTIIS